MFITEALSQLIWFTSRSISSNMRFLISATSYEASKEAIKYYNAITWTVNAFIKSYIHNPAMVRLLRYPESFDLLTRLESLTKAELYNYWEHHQQILLKYVNILDPREYPYAYECLNRALNDINDLLFDKF